ncbi:hypothetical protein [Microbulbifer sp. GL-2]|uniref:hypothetical protein n=1 Tax=Microbulbifer sp. GL-2 TaxID=2591606 RepID=UPI001165A336|nr:hypothetical protein [Microbulbifer sp. GL-2]BBM02956.1 hypothetical protein GL2_30300 [Microbulbifer sp. GL-2]
MIRRFLLILNMLLVVPAYGSGGPEEVELSPDSALKLGFKVKIAPEGSATMVEIIGPPAINNGCLPARSGSFILDKSGKEISVYITELPRRAESPKTVGYLVSKNSTSMGVFIDYFCPGERIYESKRYTITSIEAWNS